ncbi:MYND-type domain-containing protein [Mycena kentingensis (nom. inval.)]|nr:MYND-type domain-containing protein [Mycena kentingensis (nom. inval.)]
MHESLGLSRLSTLPETIRRYADSAVKGSLRDLRFVNALGYRQVPQQKWELFLPVYYHILKPDHIPVLREAANRELEAEPPRSLLDVLECAMIAIQSIGVLAPAKAVPKDAVPDLWERLWPFIDLLDTYMDALPLSVDRRRTAYPTFGEAIIYLGDVQGFDDPKDIALTVGVYRVVGRAWRELLLVKDKRTMYFPPFLEKLDRRARVPASHVHDLVAGVGGSYTELAKAIVAHFDMIFPSHDVKVDRTLGDRYPEHAALGVALWKHGLATRLVRGCRAMHHCTDPSVQDRTRMISGYYFGRLVVGINYPHPGGRRIFVEALNAGFLVALTERALDQSRDTSNPQLTHILHGELSQMTNYRSVLRALRSAIAQVPKTLSTKSWASEVRVAWTGFNALVVHRLDLLNAYEGGGRNSVAVEDAVKPGTARPPASAGDWDANHRSECGLLQLPPAGHPELNRKDRAFLRALLNYEYTANRELIANALVTHHQTHPSALPYVLFNLHLGWSEISVKSLADLPIDAALRRSATLQVAEARARRSGGRVQLHLVQMDVEYGRSGWELVPMYAASAVLESGLRAVAARMTKAKATADSDEWKSQVKALLKYSFVETH